MDAINVDVTDLPAPEIGEEAELWGDRVPVAEVARRAGTISYTLLTGVAARVPRHYVEESAQWRGQPPRASTAIPQIGRASCRERVETPVRDDCGKRKQERGARDRRRRETRAKRQR